MSNIQSLPLTQDERALLSGKRTKALIAAPLMAGASILFLLVLVGLVLAGFFSLFLVALLLFSLAFAAKALTSAIKSFRFNRDLRDGQKRLISAPIEAQDVDVVRGGSTGSASYRFWIRAAGIKLTVTEEQYYQVKKGDMIEAYVAPNSGTVFGIADRSAGKSLAASPAVTTIGARSATTN